MNEKENNSDIVPDSKLGESIKQVVVDYLASHAETDLPTGDQFMSLQVVIDDENRLLIGEWVFDEKTSQLNKYLSPGNICGYDYSIQLKLQRGKWKVVGVDRMEIFVDPRND